MSASEGAETCPWNKTWLDQEWHLALADSFHHARLGVPQHWSCDEYVTWHFRDAKIHPQLRLAQSPHPVHCHQKGTRPIGPELALMGKTHFKIQQEKKKKSIYSMGFGWRPLRRSKGLKHWIWRTIRETKSFNDWAFCTSLPAPDHPRGHRAESKLVAYCHGSLIRGVALCTDKSRGPGLCCCFGRWAARRAC